MSLNVVITMAGRGSRFYDAGYTVPKYEIIAHDRSLFEWSMLSLKNFLTSDSRVIFVCLEENKSSDFILRQTKELGLTDIHIIELKELTDGQATSAYWSRELWNPDWPLLIYNIDTYVKPHALQPSDIRPGSDGWVPCFQVPGEHWSFVKLGDDGWAVDLAEKQRISDFASIGSYWFARASRYVELYDRFFSDPKNLVRGEKYIAPIYRQLLAEGGKVSLSDLNLGDVHVLGTPTELDRFLQLPATDL
ncbi:glycosyltransferase family 2 protein [Brucella sp. 6810]|uniref:glycosyltransferase family 2 protein n=1 Tax=Brucella sp. 6810 TaxID=2769351 RepID=UPI00165C3617|nr:glycosyltransferase family 2 protein [Brucella sp. 6810]QNQ61403.1 glycosyltransferase family 2 protein [Brucella sp. 6810]